ncbi:cellulase family glycosylhydrolase [Streptomyces sp. CB03238]|uniref:cellulase family glycosylhydrolase n=1 Tax=Streptomyces sp. CB03238 TaxID=1907777 RepID=UPI000A110CA6|nr:cellulase family glycosylhydrolase [Streptomyces sp. CB03238]ORT58317.1 mannan endo-1,4-beta-mannosidase [Streptomyces sp. CB03238]
MRFRTALAATVLGLTGVLGALLTPAQATTATAAATGFRISDSGRLLESNGDDFVMRGVNHAHTWYPTRTSSLADIKALGANTVRVVLSTGDRWARNDTADVAAVAAQCRQNRLICVLEAHDTTGYGEQSGAVSLSRAADYWIGVKSALEGQERYVIVNIGNEPYGNTGAHGWTSDTKAAIQKLRAAGFAHTLMVDAPNWGQDWSFTMRDNAASVFAADPERNTVFSVHMYGVFDTAAEINAYLNHFVAARLPIVVGEFGHNHSDGDPDEDTILAATQALGLGYLGWSWSGNGGGVEYLDMAAGFDATALTPWGRRIFHGPNGIAHTSKEATVYAGTGGTAPCAVTYRVTGQWTGGFQGELTVRNRGSAPVNGWTLAWTFPNGQNITQMWGGTPTRNGPTVTVTPAPYTSMIPANGSVSLGFLGTWNGSNEPPAAFTLNGAACSPA